jgi:hypothetical protein
MFKKIFTATCGLALLSTSVLAQATCDMGKLSGLIDTYANAPFSARTWRVLNGLGDPMIEASSGAYNGWENQEAWKKLAAAVLPAGQAPQEIGYDCRIGYPFEVLQKRVAALGKEAPYVLHWLRAQEKVIQVCTNPGITDVALPAPIDVDPTLATMQADDRAYQEASIAFYRDKPKAIELFRAIGKSNSPHKAAARYNVANLLANGKSIAEARAEASTILQDPSLVSVHSITQELVGYIANIEDTPEGWTELIDNAVKTIEAPAKDILTNPKAGDDYARALNDVDYAGVRGKRDDWWLTGTLPANPTISKAIYDASRKHPMALWMMAGQSAQEAYDSAPWTLVGDKWKARMASYIDQAEALQALPALPKDVLDSLRAKPDDATREALWTKVRKAAAAAQNTCGEAPETAALGVYLTHATRLSATTGKYDQAYEELSKLPFKGANFYGNVVLRKLMEQVLGQGPTEEGRKLRDRLLTPEFFGALDPNYKTTITDNAADFMGWIAEDEAHWKSSLALQSQKTSNPILNLLPIKSLWAYAGDPVFADDQKALLARAAWTREYALGGTPVADATTKLHAANPKLKEAADRVATDYPKLSVERQRLLTILRNPRFGILVNAPESWTPFEFVGDDFTDVTSGDHNDRNWWCPMQPDRQLGGLRDGFDADAGLLQVDQYGKQSLAAVYDQSVRDGLIAKREALLKQHPMLRVVNWNEFANLSTMASAPKLLTQAAIRWGKASKGDDGAAEALALAVKTTRYGCNWHGRHGTYSKAALTLLRTKFPDSPWAKQTPYWFDCQRNEWDKKYNKVAVCEAKTWPKQTLPK